MHDHGYTYNGEAPITGLTRYEIDKLQLGYIVEKEREAEQQNRQRGGGVGERDPVAQRKREHKQSIERRLREQD